MAFPKEMAEQARRRILEMCQDHIRSVLDALREACILINAYQNGDESLILQHYATVLSHVEKAWEVKRTIMREVAEIGELLTAREDFINLSAEVNEIADYCGAIAYRMTELSKRRWKVPQEILKEVSNLAEASLNALIRLREVILALSYSSGKVMELALEVESAEKTVDSIHRKADLKIISSRMRLPVLLLVREVVEFLEDIADNAENAADIARIIALTA